MTHKLSLLSPEAQLLLLAAGGDSNDHQVHALLRTGVNWSRLTALAAREQAAPILWRRLTSIDAGVTTAADADHLRKLAAVAEFRAAHLERRLRATLAALESAGIDVVLLKGAALACSVYRGFAFRPMGDLDLLVAREHAREAYAVLQMAGWAGRASSGDDRYDQHQHLAPLDDAQGTGVGLDLHTDLFSGGHPFGLSAALVWSGARSASRFGQRAYLPHPHHQLLHTALHFSWSHMMETGSWRTFRDVAALTGSGEIDWAELVVLARDCRAATCCYWTLRLARNVAGVEVPGEVVAMLAPRLPRPVLEALERHFVLSLLPSESVCPSIAVNRAMWRLAVMPRSSGHGAARPWDRTHVFLTATGATASGSSRLGALASHLAHNRVWRRYCRAMLFGG